MDRKYEKRISGKSKELNPLVSCCSKTCKTKCSRKESNGEIKGNLETICSNYGNGKNGDKPEQKHEELHISTDEIFSFKDIEVNK